MVAVCSVEEHLVPKFLVQYELRISTRRQDVPPVAREVEVALDKRPKRSDFSWIEQTLEEEFLRKHRQNKKNLVDVWCKVKRVIPVS